MSFSVVTNISSITARSMLSNARANVNQALHQLISGSRINSSADEAAGLVRANRYRLDNTTQTVGVRNANDAGSQLQVEDGALNNISSLMGRATTLAAQAASDTFTGDRAILNEEFQSVMAESSRTASAAGLETGGANLDVRKVFVGNTQTNTSDSVSYFAIAANDSVDTQGLGLDTQDILSQDGAAAAISKLQDASGTLGTFQARTGSAMNRLSYAASQSQRVSASLQASESRIRDADIAEAIAELTKNRILPDSGIATLSYGELSSESVLKVVG
jgi:flagellin